MFNITSSIQILCKIPVCINFFRTLHNFPIKHKILYLIDQVDTKIFKTEIVTGKPCFITVSQVGFNSAKQYLRKTSGNYKDKK